MGSKVFKFNWASVLCILGLALVGQAEAFADGFCTTCGYEADYRQPNNLDYLIGFGQTLVPIGTGLIQRSMFNRSLDKYYSAYNNNLDVCIKTGVPCSGPNGPMMPWLSGGSGGGSAVCAGMLSGSGCGLYGFGGGPGGGMVPAIGITAGIGLCGGMGAGLCNGMPGAGMGGGFAGGAGMGGGFAGGAGMGGGFAGGAGMGGGFGGNSCVPMGTCGMDGYAAQMEAYRMQQYQNQLAQSQYIEQMRFQQEAAAQAVMTAQQQMYAAQMQYYQAAQMAQAAYGSTGYWGNAGGGGGFNFSAGASGGFQLPNRSGGFNIGLNI